MFPSHVLYKQLHVYHAYMSSLLSYMLNYTVSSLGACLQRFCKCHVIVSNAIFLEMVEVVIKTNGIELDEAKSCVARVE